MTHPVWSLPEPPGIIRSVKNPPSCPVSWLCASIQQDEGFFKRWVSHILSFNMCLTKGRINVSNAHSLRTWTTWAAGLRGMIKECEYWSFTGKKLSMSLSPQDEHHISWRKSSTGTGLNEGKCSQNFCLSTARGKVAFWFGPVHRSCISTDHKLDLRGFCSCHRQINGVSLQDSNVSCLTVQHIPKPTANKMVKSGLQWQQESENELNYQM